MNKKDFKNLKPGKRVYIVQLEDRCECPLCDGSCSEPEMWDAKVDSIRVDTGDVLVNGYGYLMDTPYLTVFTRKKDAEKRLRELSV